MKLSIEANSIGDYISGTVVEGDAGKRDEKRCQGTFVTGGCRRSIDNAFCMRVDQLAEENVNAHTVA